MKHCTIYSHGCYESWMKIFQMLQMIIMINRYWSSSGWPIDALYSYFHLMSLKTSSGLSPNFYFHCDGKTSVRNCCLSCSPKPVDLMKDQQLYNVDHPLDQQDFIVTKLQYKYSLHVSIIYPVFYKFILWRTTHFVFEPAVFLNYWFLEQALILLKVEHWVKRDIKYAYNGRSIFVHFLFKALLYRVDRAWLTSSLCVFAGNAQWHQHQH